ncbi:MAG TPA: hypothetical protein PLL92_07260 [Alicycliphilus sp.]|nr:hypothetical protein [Alicycliphilus sp.]
MHTTLRTWRRWTAGTTLFAASLVCTAGETSLSGYSRLNGPQVRATIAGAYVTDDHHWAHHYLSDGRLTRVQESRIRYGRWSVRDRRLCLALPELGTEPACYLVQSNGKDLQYLDDKGYVVWQGTLRSRAAARMLAHVPDAPAAPARRSP